MWRYGERCAAAGQVIGEEGERWTAGMWSSGSIERHLLSATAIAVQWGNAMALAQLACDDVACRLAG